MKPEEQRIAIAEACGWKFCDGSNMVMEHKQHGFRGVQDAPDYLNDLNACQEFWNCLGWEEKNECVEQLKDIVNEADCESYFATAPQRCEAFLRTLGLWREE